MIYSFISKVKKRKERKVKNQKCILIDTDIGDDIDDALAIAFAIGSTEIQVKAITTVFKNTSERAKLTQALLKIYERENIPVYEGIGKPIVNEIAVDEIPCQCQVVNFEAYNKNECHAVDAIISTVRENPDIIIVAIGPLTNIAMAIRKAPEVMGKSNIFIMGGAFGIVEPEWNICCDPEAASVVFRSGANIKVFGLDVTVSCTLSEKQMNKAASCRNEKSRFLVKLMEAWMQTSGYGVTLHDALTVAAIVDPDLVQYEEKEVIVELRGENTRGATIVKQSFFGTEEYPNVKVASKVKTEQFLNLFMERVFSDQE